MADDCTDDPLTCPCPSCVEWRDDHEGLDPDGQPITIQEIYEQAVREREELRR